MRKPANAKLVEGIINKVDSKYRTYLETTPDLEFYLADDEYYVKMDSHFDKLGMWGDLVYFLDCQMIDQ